MDKPRCKLEYRLFTMEGNCFNNSGILLVYLGSLKKKQTFHECFKRNILKFRNKTFSFMEEL